MKQPWKAILWIAAIMGIPLSLLILRYAEIIHQSRAQEETHEYAPHELIGKWTHLDSSIHLMGGFEASSYGGWHGDGGSISIHLIAPGDTGKFIDGLKHYYERQRTRWPDAYEFKWSRSSKPELCGLERLIPRRYQPKRDDYLIARSARGDSIISIGITSGYICFAHSTT